jgi:hypothetical protein
MKARQLGVLTLFLTITAALAAPVWAITPFDRTVDASEDMEHDTDAYTPSDTDPLNDPLLAGDTPGAGPADLGGPPDFLAGQDWFDIRNGGVGVIEEVPSGFLGIAAPVGSYNGHVASPHSAGHFAIVQFEGGDGPFGRQNRQSSVNPAPGSTGGRTGYWATADIYIDPAIAYGGPDGIPDFWLTNAINGTPASPAAGSYLSESGITGTVDPLGTTWTIATTNGQFLGVVPVGSWIGWEMEPKASLLFPGLVTFEHRLYSDGGSHTTLIGTTDHEDYLGGALGGYADVSGPRYNWFTFPNANMTHVFADNVGWTAVPEPSTTILAGIGALGMIGAYRRRRRDR